jgi:uncharacterized membrane protein
MEAMPGFPGLPGFGTSDFTTSLTLLITALGLSSASGLRAYLPLLAVAIGSNIPTSDGGHLIQLSPPFDVLGSPWFIVLVLVLSVVEFIVDKIPLIDHISDAIHTVIRPAAGALIMVGTSNPLSNNSPIAAAIVGGALALTVHGAKAATRPVATATTFGIGNPILSIVEDVISIVLILLSILAPILALIFFVLLLLAVARPLARGIRRILLGPRTQPQTQSRSRAPALEDGPMAPTQL